MTTPTHGDLLLAADGGFSYTPDTGYSGEDSFTYRAYDGQAYSAPTTVQLTITAVSNSAPVTVSDSYTTTQDMPLVVAAPGVLGNDSDPENDVLTADFVTLPAHGTLALQADGGFSYAPDAGYSGEDSFTYRAYDGQAYSEPTTVQLIVTPVTATYELFLPVILQP
ncbi:MAG: Ig-like domain-containing protein [Chloroflexota bacterium]